MSQVNDTVLSTPKINTAFHFKKEYPSAESHILVHAFSAADINPVIRDYTGAIPSTGSFGSTAIFTNTDTTGARIGVFSNAPNGQVAFADGKDTVIWGGDESRVGRFINFVLGSTDKWDFTDILNNNLADSNNVATMTNSSSSGLYNYVGFTRPFTGVKFYVDNANSSTMVLNAEYFDRSSSWTSVANLVDGTAATGSTDTPFSQTGTVYWDDVSSSHVISGIDQIFLYWIRFGTTNNVSANTRFSQATVQTKFQDVNDIWDGEFRKCDQFWSNSSEIWKDLTLQVNEDAIGIAAGTFNGMAANLTDPYSPSHYIGSLDRLQGYFMRPRSTVKDKMNTSGLTVSYWEGSSWLTVDNLNDNTKNSASTHTYNRAGLVSWTPPTEIAERQKSINGSIPLYYYKIDVGSSFDGTADFEIDILQPIPASKPINQYSSAMLAKDRLWLIDNTNDKRNSALVSAKDTSDVFNGEDSIEFMFGDETPLMGGQSLYSVLGSNIFEIALLFKKDAMFGVSGNSPEDFKQYEITISDGLVAKQTLKPATISVKGTNVNVVIWQGSEGLYMFDNKAQIPIHTDIDNFFDQRQSSSANRISTDYMDRSVGFVDEENQEYHWLFPDDASTGQLNREFAFDLKRLQWFEIDRGSSGDLQTGFTAQSTKGKKYSYGTIDQGRVERLEYGNDFDGNSIDHEMWTADRALDKGSVMQETELRKVKLIAKSTTSTTQTIIMSHFVNGDTSASSTSTLSTIKSGRRLAIHDSSKKSLSGKPSGIFHSLKFNISSTNEEVGFSPIYIGGHFKRKGDDR